MKGINEKIETAWFLRTNQRNEECLEILSELKSHFSIPYGKINLSDINVIAHIQHIDELIETLLLCSSIARAQKQFAYSVDLLSQIENILQQTGKTPNFRFFFEKGLSRFLSGDFQTSLELFQVAVCKVSDDYWRLCAQMNALLCLENLGFPYTETLKKIELLLETLKDRKEINGIKTQLKAFRERQSFRHGQISDLMVTHPCMTGDSLTQSEYFRSWINMLPYQRYFSPTSGKEVTELFLNSPFFFQRSYRMRTLQGLLHPEDAEVIKPSEWVDRFYLWTWQWLHDPTRFPVQRLMSLVRKINLFDAFYCLTLEDRQMLRNALLWVSLFDSGSFRFVESMMNKIKDTGASDYPLFEIEKLTVHYFIAIRDRKEILAADIMTNLKNHPLWGSDDLFFRQLIESTMDGSSGHQLPISGLAKNISDMLNVSESKGSHRMVVDLTRFQVVDRQKNKEIISESVCLALELFRGRDTVSFEKLAAVCFGITRYEPLIHNPKIYNLLARIKDIAESDLKIKTKSGVILCEGKWNNFHFLKINHISASLGQQEEWRDFVYYKANTPDQATTAAMAKKADLSKLKGKEIINRKQIEELLGKPRSTTNRLLKKWISEGLIKRKGNSRSTVYSINGKLLQRLETGGVFI